MSDNISERGCIPIRRRYLPLTILLAVCLFSIGCTRIQTAYTALTAEEEAVNNILERLTDSRAVPVFGKALSFNRQIAIVLEGYSNEAEMMELADFFRLRNLDVTFFIPGAQAMEHPAVIKYIADAGISVGNYCLTGETEMEMNKAKKNARQLYLTQKAIQAAGAPAPRYFRCNLTEYSDEILKLAGLCGLEAAVQPSVYLNHRSFANKEQAIHFVRSMPRGSILTIKVSQELGEAELYTPPVQNARPADDPKGTIDDGLQSSPDPTEQNDVELLHLLQWILDACEMENHKVVSLGQLQQASEEAIPENEIPEELLEKLDLSLYPNLVTPEPFGAQESAAVDDSFFNRAVFVGDSIMVGVQNHVEQMRRENPTYFGTAIFLAGGGLSVRNALWQVSDESRHPAFNGRRMPVEDAIGQMDVDKVYIMLGMNDILLSDLETYLSNYQTLIRLIMEQSPGVEIYIQSITPGTSKQELEPNNVQILEYNLALVAFCAKYGYHYVDVAYALRGEDGSLPAEMCSDPDGMGFHFSSEACGIWADYIYRCTV